MDTDDRAQDLRVGPQGRIVIPAGLRRSLGLAPGTELIARVEDGHLILARREEVLGAVRALFAAVPASRVLSQELIEDRRLEVIQDTGSE